MLKQLLERKAALISEIKSILTKADENEDKLLSEDQKLEVEAKKEELGKVKSQIELVQGFDEEDLANEEKKSTPVVAGRIERRAIPGPEAKKSFESLDEWLTAVMNNPNDQRLEFQEYQSEQRMDSGSAGGFAVPKQFLPEVRSKEAAPSIVRPRASVLPAGTPPDAEITFPALDQEPDAQGNHRLYGGVEVNKVSEGGQKPLTGFALREISLKPHEIAAIIPMTDKLLRNWTAASNWAVRLLRAAMGGFEDNECLKGNGIGGPSSVLDSSAAYAVARAVSSQISLADLKEMYSRFGGDEGRGFWPVSRGGFSQLLNITGDGGGATNIIDVDRSTGSVNIYGMPVVRTGRMRALGQRGDIALLDLNDYAIKDGSGPIVEMGYDDGQFRNNKRSIKITWNVDGKPLYTKPFRDEEGYDVSPFVVLDVPAGS
jgi:HK97 family phage major capsid protein